MPQKSRRPGSGPMGRIFNRILGEKDGATDTAHMCFDAKQLRQYIDKDLRLAEGEWFRGTKLSGAAAGLVEKLDTTGDGMVSWDEFQAFRTEILESMAPGLTEQADAQEVSDSAGATFEQGDRNQDGSIDFDEAQQNVRQGLPEETEHKGLVAQLGARLMLDAVDTDQRQEPVADRRVSRAEWVTAAQQMKGA